MRIRDAPTISQKTESVKLWLISENIDSHTESHPIDKRAESQNTESTESIVSCEYFRFGNGKWSSTLVHPYQIFIVVALKPLYLGYALHSIDTELYLMTCERVFHLVNIGNKIGHGNNLECAFIPCLSDIP